MLNIFPHPDFSDTNTRMHMSCWQKFETNAAKFSLVFNGNFPGFELIFCGEFGVFNFQQDGPILAVVVIGTKDGESETNNARMMAILI